MLCLNRQKGESVVVIGDGGKEFATVRIGEMTGRNVQLLIYAPPGVTILREELIREPEGGFASG